MSSTDVIIMDLKLQDQVYTNKVEELEDKP